MATVATVIELLERIAPLELGAEWDNLGLLLGVRDGPVERVMTCLTITPESAAEAVAERADLIVTHHPILFRPAQRLTDASAEGRMLLSLARAGVAVYSPHTAFDNAAGGINDILAARLGLQDVAPLRRRDGLRQCKLVVFVPDSDLAKVSEAVFSAGAGIIGPYRECSFRVAGTGTFFGGEAANPSVGKKGRREEVSEWRLEVVCPEAQVSQVVAAMRRSHSYEEPAFDVYPLRPPPDGTGEGRFGRLPQPAALRDLAGLVKTRLSARTVQVIGDANRVVERIAVVCGAGGSFLSDAARAGADVLLTGEARFHDYLAAQAQGLALLLPGHYATERCGAEELAGRIGQAMPELTVWASRSEQDPSGWT